MNGDGNFLIKVSVFNAATSSRLNGSRKRPQHQVSPAGTPDDSISTTKVYDVDGNVCPNVQTSSLDQDQMVDAPFGLRTGCPGQEIAKN
jgi:hypothetical protein